MVEKAMLTQVVGYQFYMMLNRRWLYDKLLNDLFGMPSYKLGYHMLMVLTKGF
jgi:hypothetical protein